MTTVIEFSAVAKSYAGQAVLDTVNFQVEAGQCYALVGVNGAGKTTCIKALLDFVALDAGHIRICGNDHTRPGARRPLVFLPERFLPPYHLSGGEFLRYMSCLHGQPRPVQAFEQALIELDLDPAVLTRPAREYSKGMAQKLGLVACLSSGKDLFVLDEPMSGLDPKARMLVKRRLAALRDEGRSFFFSTHVLADVEAVCDRMAILHEGRIRFCGSPRECCERYAAPDLESAYLACLEDESPARDSRDER